MHTLGFLYPGLGAEDDYPYMDSLLGDDISLALVHTSVGVDAHEVDALIDIGNSERLAEGATALASAQPHSVMWACTSGSFVYGLEGARAQAQGVEDIINVPTSSTSLAFVEALQYLGLSPVAVAATYPDPVSQRFISFLEDAGIDVLGLISHDLETAALAGGLSQAEVVQLALSNNPPEAQAVLLPDTAMHTARYIPEIEEALGKPVLTANQVTLWQALRLANLPVPSVPQLGALFA
jgi:maleate cis-trans isomerase